MNKKSHDNLEELAEVDSATEELRLALIAGLNIFFKKHERLIRTLDYLGYISPKRLNHAISGEVNFESVFYAVSEVIQYCNNTGKYYNELTTCFNDKSLEYIMRYGKYVHDSKINEHKKKQKP